MLLQHPLEGLVVEEKSMDSVLVLLEGEFLGFHVVDSCSVLPMLVRMVTV